MLVERSKTNNAICLGPLTSSLSAAVPPVQAALMMLTVRADMIAVDRPILFPTPLLRPVLSRMPGDCLLDEALANLLESVLQRLTLSLVF